MITFKLVCSRCGADWKSDDGCSAACESTPVMATRIAALEAELEREHIRLAVCRKCRENAEAKLAVERNRRKAAEALLYNYSSLANAAMFDANRNGYEYDRKGEMVDVREHFARYKD